MYNIPKKTDTKDLLEIFGKFEKIIFLKINNYQAYNNYFCILCVHKIDKKNYKTKIFDNSLYDVLTKIRSFKNNYRLLAKKIKKIDDFNYY